MHGCMTVADLDPETINCNNAIRWMTESGYLTGLLDYLDTVPTRAARTQYLRWVRSENARVP